ncbi:MAG: PmoA family protein [Planctomycetia bacterium]|nr:PmoA family protein [Planctomycetia bacterium]
MALTLRRALVIVGLCFFPYGEVASAADTLALTETPHQHVDLTQAGRLAARFMIAHDISSPERRAETYKPYLHVFALTDGTRLTKGPGGSFPHHRGIFVGYNKIEVDGKKFDRWHMTGGDQIVRKVAVSSNTDKPELKAEIEWEAAAGTPLLTEERTFTFTTLTKPFYLGIEMTSALRPVAGEATLDGDPEHAGAQFRPSEKIDGKQTVYLFPGDGIDAKKDRDLAWAAEVFTVEGKTFTVAILNHPDNPRDTRFSAYRDYGRFGAFPKATATAEKPLKLRYKWVVAEGDVRDAAAFQTEWNTFAGKNDPTPKLTIRPADQPAPKKPEEPKKPEPKKESAK